MVVVCVCSKSNSVGFLLVLAALVGCFSSGTYYAPFVRYRLCRNADVSYYYYYYYYYKKICLLFLFKTLWINLFVKKFTDTKILLIQCPKFVLYLTHFC